MAKRILIVGPINNLGKGGRFEEMKLWEQFLEELQYNVAVFSMFNSNFQLGNAIMVESASLKWPRLWSNYPWLRGWMLRFWGSRAFKSKRDAFYDSKVWENFAASFDHILLFITHHSKEIKIFQSLLPVKVSIRFTGTIHKFSVLEHHKKLSSTLKRNYVFHSPFLSKGLDTPIPKHFIDQTTLAEQKLLEIPLTGSVKVFGMVGLFMEVKQMDQVVLLFKELSEFDLILFGSGPLQKDFEKLLQEEKLSNVKLAGFILPAEIHQVYSAIDCLIINSLEETGPMTGVEAMAAGRLILSRPVGAMPDRLVDMDLMYDSPSDLKDKIEEIGRKSDQELLQMKQKLRKNYLERYSNRKLKLEIKNLVD